MDPDNNPHILYPIIVPEFTPLLPLKRPARHFMVSTAILLFLLLLGCEPLPGERRGPGTLNAEIPWLDIEVSLNRGPY